jgi:TRAP-type C4-dicarboxylate transport system substrate-binding protein
MIRDRIIDGILYRCTLPLRGDWKSQRRFHSDWSCYSPPQRLGGSMGPIVIKFGGYQGPTSINTRSAARFGEVLERGLGERVRFELIGDVLALGRKSGELPEMVESGELTLCYMSTGRFAPAVPELKLLELP